MDEGHTVDLIYRNFAKAFGSVFHRFPLARLKPSVIDGGVLSGIKPYNSGRSCQIQIDGVLLEEVPCLSGAPQGSVIGSLFFCYT